MLYKYGVSAALALVFTCSGCAGSGTHAKSAPAPQRNGSSADQSLANGRSIFMTGRDLSGVHIRAKSRPLRTSCAACHKPDGSGGVRFADGAVSADLRHAALVTKQKHPYTVALLQRAISTGIDNEGKPLDPVMPRWQMSARELHDVAEYVYTRLK